MTEDQEARLKAFEILLRGSFIFSLNMNDVFVPAADSEDMYADDFDKMVPIINKYGSKALIAYAAIKSKCEPMDCPCNHKNDKYYAAKKEIEELKKNDEYFMMD